MNWKLALGFAMLGLLWGTEWLAAGTLASQVPPLTVAAARFALAAAVLFPWIVLKGIKMPRGRTFRATLILSVLIALPNVLLVWADRRTPPAAATTALAATPLMTALMMSIGANRRVPRIAWQAMLLGLGGIALAIWSARSLPPAASGAAVVLAVVSVAASIVYAKQELQGINPAASAAFALGGAAVLLALASLASERGRPVDWNASAIDALAYLGVLAGAAGFCIFFWLLKRLEAYQVATIVWVESLLAMVEGAIFWRQTLSPLMASGLAINLGCLIMVMRARAGDEPLSLLGTAGRN